MKPLISICTPNYNYEKFIAETIESVLAQTYQNYEFIIIDNASTDESVNIIKQYKDSRIRFFRNEENIPVYMNVNKAMSYANGEFIAVLHSDDVYDPKFLEEIVNAYNKYPDYKVFVTDLNLWHYEENKLNRMKCYKSGGIKKSAEVLIRLSVQNNIGNFVNMVLHRECYRKVGTLSDKYKYSADYDLLLRMAEHYDFVYIPKPLAYYRIHKYNITHDQRKNLNMFKEGIEIITQNLKNSCIVNEKLDELIDIRHKYMIHRAFFTGKYYKSGDLTRKELDLTRKLHPKIIFDPFFYATYAISFLLNDKLPEKILGMLTYFTRIILYPHMHYLNNKIKKVIRFYNDKPQKQKFKKVKTEQILINTE